MEIAKEPKQERSLVPRAELECLIDEWITGYNCGDHAERNRAIMKRRLLDGIIFEDLAEEFDLPVRQVKSIVKRCNIILSKHIRG